MNEMEGQVQEYKRKYDAVRIELRNLKGELTLRHTGITDSCPATSTMFVSKPVNDDHLPASPDGNIADIHVSSFQAAIDGMLQAARSSTPSGVLPAMKAIVEAITEIGEDVKAFEAAPNLDVDVSRLESLKHESTTRLNYLMQAARNHAMASGLSPVSLIDAAAGHVTSNVVEIIKLLKIRRTNKNSENGAAVESGGLGAGLRSSKSSMSIKDMVDRTLTGTPEIRSPPIRSPPIRSPPIRSPPTRSMNAYGAEERLREPSQMTRQLSVDDQYRPAGSPVESRPNGVPNLRINSYQSTTSSIARSDSFDLERKASVMSDRQAPGMPSIQRGLEDLRTNGFDTGVRYGRMSEESHTSGSGSSAPAPVTADVEGYRYGENDEPEVFSNEGGNEQEWDDVKVSRAVYILMGLADNRSHI